MGLSQALYSGVSGLLTHQKAMDNVGNNIANVNTVGFKKGVFQFRTILEQSLRGGMTSDATTGRGAINPVSLGLGTSVGSIMKDFTQGPHETTNNPKHMAIDGNGFFVLRMGTGYAYTRDGTFYLGAEGELLAGNGLQVQGVKAVRNFSGATTIPSDAIPEDLVIPIGKTGAAAQTSQIAFSGNIDDRQETATGLRLFGSQTYPTVNNMQQWMWTDFNGGDPATTAGVDYTWTALEGNPTYMIDYNQWLEAGSPPIPGNYDVVFGTLPAGMTSTPPDGSLEVIVDGDNTAVPPIPAVYGLSMIKTINGGNVQTSAPLGVKTPAYLAVGSTVDYYNAETGYTATFTVQNDTTFPPWFYAINSGTENADAVVAAAFVPGALPTDIWVEGTRFDQVTTSQALPQPNEIYEANLDTPLEYLYYKDGNTWTQPFAGITNGEEITIEFKKGERAESATFTYNKPTAPTAVVPPQVAIGNEKSYTLRHFMEFLAGDVDSPTYAAWNLDPYDFADAFLDPSIPAGDPGALDPADPRNIAYARERGVQSPDYARALANTTVAQGLVDNAENWNARLEQGGIMGLLKIPAQISSANDGTSAYDAPPESAGAYSRYDVGKVDYQRYVLDPQTGLPKLVDQQMPSFNVSLVSNLGLENALSDIRVSYKSVPHTAMFSAETEYSEPQGGGVATSMVVYDSLGNPKVASIRLTKVSEETNFTTYRWYADCNVDTDAQWLCDDQGNIITNLNVGTGLIRFDADGNFVKGAEFSETAGITINQIMEGVSEPIRIKLLNGLSPDLTQDLDMSALTAQAKSSGDFGESFNNGSAPGTLRSFTLSLDGVIQGVYDNGKTEVLGRLVLAMVPNENGLVAAGANLFFEGTASGAAIIGFPGTGGRGEIVQGALETSNVDLSEEFTKMITTERGFQANARTITTADEMLQELLNIKR